eukprot:gene9405-10393_t
MTSQCRPLVVLVLILLVKGSLKSWLSKTGRIYVLESRLKAKKSIFPVPPQKVNNSEKFEKAFKFLDGLVSQELLSFMKKQVSLCQVKKKGRRYNDSFKALAISIYHISGKAYRFLSKLFSLPSKKTITSTVSRFASGVGFSKKSLYVLKQRIDVLPDAGKTCVLLMDEISLKTHLYYDKVKDCIAGLEDLGDGHTSGLVATCALVLMIRGIVLKWKQPFAYYLVHESCSGMHLKDILSGALLHLEELRLNDVAIASDRGSNVLSLAAKMGVTLDKPYFQIRKTDYFVIYDPPHLIIEIRNNVIKYNFEYGLFVAKWNDIKIFYRQDEKQIIQLAPKLTEKHFNLTLDFQK